MNFRLLVSFLAGAAFFTVLPIYAPFILLQSEQTPRFLVGLGAGVVAGAVLVLVNGAARGLLLVLACAFVGAFIYVFAYFVPMFSQGGDWWFLLPSALLFALAYLVLPAAVGWALAVLASSLLARRGRAVHQSARVPTPEADVAVPPPPRRPPTVAAGEGVVASPSRQRRRNLAVLLLIVAIVLAGIVGFVSTLVVSSLPVANGGSVASNIGLAIAGALWSLVKGAIIAMLAMLLGGGVVYLLDRDQRGSANTSITFLQAAFSWQVLMIAAGLVLLISLGDVASVQQAMTVVVEEPPSRP